MSALRRGAAAATTSPALSQSASPGPRPRLQTPEDEDIELRPRTCPILTSQFHWNLNTHAVKSLAEDELAQVYRLFRFYNSSTVGDSLPSINCRRFLQLLGDGGLLCLSPTGLPNRSLATATDEPGSVRFEVAAVEKIFAEAVMGKLRTYFDADGQPVLTFHLFCGALMNCAMTIFPVHRTQPAVAMMQLLEKLLTAVDHYADERQRESRRSKSLLQHFPREGPSALWSPNEAHGAVACMPSSMASGESEHGRDLDFRALKPFQQVLASFSDDVVINSKARERSQQQYTIPADVAAHFSPNNLTLVVERFQLFDVFDRGTLPRQEILPLLTGLVKKLEITDMYEVLTLLLTGEHVSRYGKVSVLPSEPSHAAPTAEISLTDVLKAIHTCQRSRKASSYGSSGGSHNVSARRPTKPSLSGAELSGGTDAQNPLAAAAESNCEGEEDGELGSLEGKELGDKRASKKSLRRSKASGLILQAPLTSSKLINASKNTADKKPSGATKSSTESRHKQPLLSKDQANDGGARASSITRRKSMRRSKMTTFVDGTSENVDAESTHSGENSIVAIAEARSTEGNSRDTDELGCLRTEPIDRRDSFKSQLSAASASHSAAFPEKPGNIVIPVCRSGPTSSSPVASVKTKNRSEARTQVIRVFLLLGGDHDGAICSTVKLTLPQRHVEEATCIFYQSAPHEVLERSPVLPVQPDAESALLMLRKRVQQRLSEGFVLHPLDQLTHVNAMLNRIRQSNPHYQSSLRVHHHDFSISASRVNLPAFSATSPNKVGQRMSEHRSLDCVATCDRQALASNLLVELRGSLTNSESLKARKCGLRSRCEVSAPHFRDQKLLPESHYSTFSGATEDGDLSWINALSEANRRRERRLRSAASTPALLSSSSQHELPQQQRGTKLQTPHQGVQLRPIHHRR